MHVIEVVVAAAVVGSLLHPITSHALSSVSHNARVSPYTQRCSSPSSRKYLLLAVAENHVVSEACREVNSVAIDFPVSPGSIPLQKDGTGEENTHRSSGTTFMQDFWGTEAGDNAGSNVDIPGSEFSQQFGGIGAGSCEETNTINENQNAPDHLDGLHDFGCRSESSGKLVSSSTNVPDDSRFCTVINKGDVIHRARIINDVRSSQTKAHLNRSRKLFGKIQNANAFSRVLRTVRTAALSVPTEEMQNTSLTSETYTSNLKSAIESTVADMMKDRHTPLSHQSMDVLTCLESPPLFPPPGTTSMGILGDVVQDELPVIPPIPGTCLVSASGNVDNSQVTIRASIPHSSDDTHIANLRLSVFSRFDEEQQQLHRRQSIEVLNRRRKRGSVVLVAEARNGWSRRDFPYPNEMQSRIVHGHKYGEKSSSQHGQRSVTVSAPSPTFVDVQSRQLEEGSIAGSVECSHQEFRGTILGNSRPKGALMYVTEVAVRADARRCGAGAMLMRGVVEVASLRNVESIYLHVDVTNLAARSMYEKCGFQYLDMRVPMYAQFTASLNLHDGATQGRNHHLMCKNLVERLTWLKDNDSIWTCFS